MIRFMLVILGLALVMGWFIFIMVWVRQKFGDGIGLTVYILSFIAFLAAVGYAATGSIW